MRMTRLGSIVLMTIALAACGKQQSARQQSRPASTPSAALTPPAVTAHKATETQRQEAGLAPTTTRNRRSNEDGSETVEETAGENVNRNALLTAVASTMAASTPSAAAATTSAPTPWQEGVNYTRFVPAQPTAVPAGQVEVLEFFWYGCPHCYAIDPLVESWKKTKPAFITFARVPVMWSEGHRSTARLYYTLESMGKLDQLHGEVFKEIHVNNDFLIGQ